TPFYVGSSPRERRWGYLSRPPLGGPVALAAGGLIPLPRAPVAATAEKDYTEPGIIPLLVSRPQGQRLGRARALRAQRSPARAGHSPAAERHQLGSWRFPCPGAPEGVKRQHALPKLRL